MSGSHRRRRPDGSSGVRHPGRVRLTRRGRVVVGLGLLLGGLLVVGFLLVVATPPSQAADPASSDPAASEAGGGEPLVAVVRPGDTLWSVASRHVPSGDAYGMIEEIRRLNNLSGHTIHPGQKLRLPDRR
ncbi:MAG: LysM peptidoglycan-binding domain-containing protein [Micromonosporaceae bacterium]|nr:LysM peptidoglycan-binding domain-containing protein [Micromonosporaceae bacterium]